MIHWAVFTEPKHLFSWPRLVLVDEKHIFPASEHKFVLVAMAPVPGESGLPDIQTGFIMWDLLKHPTFQNKTKEKKG